MTLWVLMRDDNFYAGFPSHERAAHMLAFYKPGSKHQWRIAKIAIDNWREIKVRKR